LFSISVSGFA